MKRLLYTIVAVCTFSWMCVFFSRLLDVRSFGPVVLTILTALALAAFLAVSGLYALKRGYHSQVFNLLLSCSALLISYVAADLCAGFFLIYDPDVRMSPDPIVHHIPAASTTGRVRHSSGDFTYRYSINSHGLRGVEFDLLRGEVPRILMLGDSFTFGVGLNESYTYPRQLELKLKERHPGISVINGGVGSYAPLLSALLLTRRLKDLQTDVVVLNLDNSDLVQEQAYRRISQLNEHRYPIAVPGTVDPSESSKGFRAKLHRWIFMNLYLSRSLAIYFHQLNSGSGKTDIQVTDDITVEQVVKLANPRVLDHTLADDLVDRTQQWNDIFESILLIKEWCAANGAAFVLVVYPWGHQVSPSEWHVGRRLFLKDDFRISETGSRVLNQWAVENDVPFLDLTEAFRNYNGSSPLFYTHDMHWTAAGAALAAQELARYLIAEKVPFSATGTRCALNVHGCSAI